MLTQPGSSISLTTDRISRAGSVQLSSDSETQLDADYALIKELEVEGLIEVN